MTRYAKAADGVHIAHQTWGTGPPDILWCGALWWHVEFQWTDPAIARGLEGLGRAGRMISFDKRGTGLSDRVPVDRLPTLEQRIQDITAVLDAVGCDAAVVWGINHGGPLAILFAATYPERTRSLFLTGTYARIVQTEEHPWGITPDQAERATRRMEEHWDEPYFPRQLGGTWAADPGFTSWWGAMQRVSASPSAVAALYQMAVATDVRAVLPTIQVPTLVAHQTDDLIVPAGCGRYLGEHIPGARYVESPGDDSLTFLFDDALVTLQDFDPTVTPTHEPDRMLATVVFTDLVASTELAQKLGDERWRRLLDRHDAVIDRAIDRHRGRKVNPTGDGVLAVFDGPARAVHFARAVVDGVGALGIDARVGVHTGEVERRGDDIGGIAVHVAARIAAEAGAQEVLVSSTVVDLVAGSGLTFQDRGSRALKGVERAWQLYVVG
ncbi:MAG: alpha/beta fold hydrolase [Acidimicrobiales bacterium]